MKQNIYDDIDFFENYGKMLRSVDGLNSAGEWHVLKNMLPDFQDKNVLDLGCGYGWHCIYAKEQGAKNVIGIDLSKKMIDKAKENSKDLSIAYYQMPVEDIEFEKEQFDIIFSSLTFHYIQNLDVVFRKINKFLKKGGSFVFSMEHPVFTSKPEQDWFKDEKGNLLHWPVDNYQDEGVRQTNFLGHKVIKYHRTVASILNTVIDSGFVIKQISEPKPSEEIIEKYPAMKDELRRPIFIMVSAGKL
ncbi:methyltransferase family protein [Flavobacterium sp. 90]|uniref:class I SAM-dependent methyltransferase n=1 Tax=unclassified Flavobacterium TaxID=196869 RepID=UPI000EB0D78E|nr:MULTISPECIES: class I SAM-dependent methyltransferase [unclassified Flavobacterium]RKR09228.1 methyltransferase family protein [Flavobacterium sp. 81]TCK53012.1 methyltransferase family protein [Flavobacterium sp. 90]